MFNKFSFIKKIVIVLSSIVLLLYVAFLVLPPLLSPIVNKYAPELEKMVKDSTGLELKINDLGLTSSPNFHFGVKFGSLNVSIPDAKANLISASGVKADLKLLPLLFKKVELGVLKADNVEAVLFVDKNGTLLLQDFLMANQQDSQEAISYLPFGLKLSNTMPNVHVGKYKFSLVDSDNKSYYIQGDKLNITDFILDKKIKIETSGKVVFDEQLISNYDIKIFNKIMPNLILDDVVFPKDAAVGETDSAENNTAATSSNSLPFTIIDAVKSAKANKLRFDLHSDIKVSGTFKEPVQKGYFKIDNISAAVNGNSLPEGYLSLLFKGKSSQIDSLFYTSFDKNELTKLTGEISLGKKASLDFKFKSNAKFNNVIRLIDSFAQSFGIDDVKTISATGGIDADFNIISDLKSVNSNGYLKVANSSLKYGLYNILVDNINANIDLSNNDVNIRNAGFSVKGHPLSVCGVIKSDAATDLKLSAENLSIKGLLGAAGQVVILKNNDIKSGTLSVLATVKGKLSDLKPDVSLSINNVNLYNKPMSLGVALEKSIVKLLIDKDKYSGDITLSGFSAKQSDIGIKVPSANISMNTKDIVINNSYVLLNNSRIDVEGTVKDYISQNLNMNIKAKGNVSSKDIMAFVPKEMYSMFPHKGVLPVSAVITGNAKEQNIIADVTATPSNYIQFADVDILKNKNTKIHAQMNISGGNTLKFKNSGIFADNKQIATFGGGVNNLSSNPKLNIDVSIPQNVSFPIWGMGKSNITAYGNMLITGTLDNMKFGGKFYLGDLSVKDMGFAMKNLVVNLNGSGIAGSATADSFRFGGITAKSLSSDFSLIDYDKFYLNNVNATSFDGKVTGKVSYNIATTDMGVDLIGKGLNSMDAVYGAVGIPKALTGKLDFNAKFTSKGISDVDIIKNMKGNVSFGVQDGRFISIGRLENLVAAQNIASNSLLKSALSALSTGNALQETDKYKSINGQLNLSGGVANITNLTVAGPMVSTYVVGKYNIIPNSANLVILGRLDSKVVSYLGPLGQLSAEKLLSYIPSIGPATAQFLDKLTQDPNGEKIDKIPSLTNGSNQYKEFKVIFNGPIERPTSVRVFKWLSKCDTSEMNIKKDIEDAKKAVQENIENRVKNAQQTAENVQKNVENIVNVKKQQVEDVRNAVKQTKQDIQDAKNNLKNLWNAVKNPQQAAPVTPTATESNTGASSPTPAASSPESSAVSAQTSSSQTSENAVEPAASVSEGGE